MDWVIIELHVSCMKQIYLLIDGITDVSKISKAMKQKEFHHNVRLFVFKVS